jgi:hypothetical protein
MLWNIRSCVIKYPKYCSQILSPWLGDIVVYIPQYNPVNDYLASDLQKHNVQYNPVNDYLASDLQNHNVQ